MVAALRRRTPRRLLLSAPNVHVERPPRGGPLQRVVRRPTCPPTPTSVDGTASFQLESDAEGILDGLERFLGRLGVVHNRRPLLDTGIAVGEGLLCLAVDDLPDWVLFEHATPGRRRLLQYDRGLQQWDVEGVMAAAVLGELRL